MQHLTLFLIFRYFSSLLSYIADEVCAEQPLVILLDALEQLAPTHGAHNMAWLPKVCPPNVSIVLTISNEHVNILDNLNVHLGNPTCWYSLDDMSTTDCELMVDTILKKNNKQLHQHYQQGIIAGEYIRCPFPLLIKILMDDALKWKSFTVLRHVSVVDVTDAVFNIFERLENVYGTFLIECISSYLALFSGGLSETELLDTLSCNDDVLKKVYENHNPSTPSAIRFPHLLWARIYSDLASYIDERQTDGKTTLCWYHSVFRQAVFKRYMNKDSKKLLDTNRYKEVATVFLEEHSLKRTIILTKRNVTIVNADRQTTPQPVSTTNLRKLRLLPPLLIASDSFDNIKSILKSLVLCNFKWIFTKLKSFGFTEIMNDYYMICHDDDEIDIMCDFLLGLSDVLRSKPQQLAIEIVCRLSHYDQCNIVSLCADARKWLLARKDPVLLPKYSCTHGGGSVILSGASTILGIYKQTHAILWSPDNGLQIWSLRMRECLYQVSTQVRPKELFLSVDNKIIYHIYNTMLVTTDVETGAKISELDILPHVSATGRLRKPGDEGAFMIVLSVSSTVFKAVILVTDSQYCVDMQNILIVDIVQEKIVNGIQEVDATMIAGAQLTDDGCKLIVAQTHVTMGDISAIRVYGLGLNTKLLECTLLETIAILPDQTFMHPNGKVCVYPCRPNDLTVFWIERNEFHTYIESDKDTTLRIIDVQPSGSDSVVVLSYDVSSGNASLSQIDVSSEHVSLETDMISDAGQPNALGLSNDSIFACVTYETNGVIEIWHLLKQRLYKVIFTEYKELTGCKFIGDKKTLAIGANNMTVTLLNITEALKDSDSVNHVKDEFNGDECNNVNNFVVCKDQKQLVTTYDNSGPVLWDVASGKVVHHLKLPATGTGATETIVHDDVIYGLVTMESFINTSVLQVPSYTGI